MYFYYESLSFMHMISYIAYQCVLCYQFSKWSLFLPFYWCFNLFNTVIIPKKQSVSIIG